MAKTTQETKPQISKEYIIPLRRTTLKVPRYKRTKKAVKAIKIYIAKHMKVPDRDTDKVKLDVYLNNEVWFRGRKSPPSKIKVKATPAEDGLIKVDFVETPEFVKFHKSKIERRHKIAEKKPTTAPSGPGTPAPIPGASTEAQDESSLGKKPSQEKPREKTPEALKGSSPGKEKKEEKEKAQAGAEQHAKQADQAAKALKHTQSTKGQQQVQRKALKK